jgi:hypothetical protein
MISNAVQGKNALMQVWVTDQYYNIACQVDFTLEYSNENILKTDVNAGSFRKRRTRISDLSGTVQGVTTTSNDTNISIFYFLQEAIRRNIQQIRFLWRSNDNAVKTIDANMLIETIDISDAMGDASKFDMKLVGGSGGLVLDPVDPPDETSDSGLAGDYWTTTEGATSITGPGVNGKSFAVKDILIVSRSGSDYIPVSLFTGVGLEYIYDGTTISFQNPFGPDETVTAVWKDA